MKLFFCIYAAAEYLSEAEHIHSTANTVWRICDEKLENDIHNADDSLPADNGLARRRHV